MTKADIQETYGLFINGEFVPASDGATFDAHNPANGEHLAYFAEATKEDVDKAVKAARAALPAWGRTSPIERQNVLLKIADIIDANLDHLALVETLDNGKPIRETKLPIFLWLRPLPVFRRLPESLGRFRQYAG